MQINRTAPLLILALSLGLASCGRPSSPARYSGEITHKRDFFIVCGDIQDKLWYEVWRADTDRERRVILKKLAEEEPEFIVQLGDLVGKGACAGNWRQLDQELEQVRSKGIPIFPTLGNHEYFGKHEEGMRHYFERFPHLQKRKWYDVRYRSLLFLMLDSNEAELSASEMSAQDAWYREKLAKAQADPEVKAVIVSSHHPAYTNAKIIRPSLFMQKHFVEPSNRFSKVKVFFAGHVHNYERFKIHGKHFVVSGGGGASQSWNSVRGPKGKYPDLYDGPRRFHFLRVSVDRNLSVEVIMMDNEFRWSKVDGFTVPLS